MATYRVLHTTTGYINGEPWPAVGETIDLGDADVSSMVDAGALEPVKAEKKPARKPAKKAATKPDKAEKRPASKAGTETRKA